MIRNIWFLWEKKRKVQFWSRGKMSKLYILWFMQISIDILTKGNFRTYLHSLFWSWTILMIVWVWFFLFLLFSKVFTKYMYIQFHDKQLLKCRLHELGYVTRDAKQGTKNAIIASCYLVRLYISWSLIFFLHMNT